MNLLTPTNWKEYELIDCGDFEKLERFGRFILRRPEPQAIWNKRLPEAQWKRMAQGSFSQKGAHSGEWIASDMPENWNIHYQAKGLKLRMKLALTAFKHVGIFPEQAANWDFIYDSIKSMKVREPKVLNLFAYTGGASLAAKAAGADVVHVDSVKQVVSWARENMELSGLDNIRWTVEDAHKFVKREVKRGKKYHGILLDPPAYGIGAKGERWKLEESLNEMLTDLAQLLDDKNYFFLLNVYSLGLSALVAENLIKVHFPQVKRIDTCELFLKSTSVMNL
ncbi:MAG: class I SAM-dependent methyltransferase, partial [Bacteroidota bacterium]|nr:class I SAM-dependent methyltransferase [Bacteroidota bacterium]MDX5430456.1 class I SAM-dependent methyltransferase [Bacteroidota bacterium]MDX5469217.1 class I SAM-dependent methyltransferase [Bacteroidota bacterium]